MMKRLRMWFWTKKRTIEEIHSISERLDQDIATISQLEALDQEKVYLCKMVDASIVDIERTKKVFLQFNKRIKWTLPTVIFTTAQIQEISDEDLKSIVEYYKKKNKRVKP